jgi:hypothetical protein
MIIFITERAEKRELKEDDWLMICIVDRTASVFWWKRCASGVFKNLALAPLGAEQRTPPPGFKGS